MIKQLTLITFFNLFFLNNVFAYNSENNCEKDGYDHCQNKDPTVDKEKVERLPSTNKEIVKNDAKKFLETSSIAFKHTSSECQNENRYLYLK